jgi:hypothetical protein
VIKGGTTRIRHDQAIRQERIGGPIIRHIRLIHPKALPRPHRNGGASSGVPNIVLGEQEDILEIKEFIEINRNTLMDHSTSVSFHKR